MMDNLKKTSNRQSNKAFPIGGFLLGLLFVIASYGVLYVKNPDLWLNRSLWGAVQYVHQANPVLFLIDCLPLVLALVGAFIERAQKGEVAEIEKLQALFGKQKEKLESLQLLNTAMFEKSEDCLIVTIPKGDIIDINWAGVRALGIDKVIDPLPDTRDGLLEVIRERKITARDFYAKKEDREQLLEELRRKGSIANYQVELRRLNGETFDAIISGFILESSKDQSLIFGRIIDLSSVKQAEIMLRKVNEQLERKNEELLKAFSELQTMKIRYENRSKDLERLNKQLSYANKLLSEMAITDGLTGLYNHRHFMELLRREWERSKRSKNSFCVIMIDVDYFKAFNDKWGHQIGDQVLKSLAGTIRGQTRMYDIVARYGGEEFGLILPDTEKNTCYTVAHRIRRAVEKKVLLIKSQNEKVHITVSVGVTIFLPEQEDPRSFEQVLQDADAALYLAKNRGRNRVEMYRRDVLSDAAKSVFIPEINREK